MTNRITNAEFDRVLRSGFTLSGLSSSLGRRLTKAQKESCQGRLETDLERDDLDSECLTVLNTVGERDGDIEHYIDCEFAIEED